jgi:hypothetical protein
MSAGRSHMIHYYEVRNTAEGILQVLNSSEEGFALSGAEGQRGAVTGERRD